MGMDLCVDARRIDEGAETRGDKLSGPGGNRTRVLDAVGDAFTCVALILAHLLSARRAEALPILQRYGDVILGLSSTTL